MLVLTRKTGEKIHIADDVVLTVVRIQGDKVRIGIEAPKEIPVHRQEIFERIRQASDAPADAKPADPPVTPDPPAAAAHSTRARSARRTS